MRRCTQPGNIPAICPLEGRGNPVLIFGRIQEGAAVESEDGGQILCHTTYGDICLIRLGSIPVLIINHPRLLGQAFARTELTDRWIADAALSLGIHATANSASHKVSTPKPDLSIPTTTATVTEAGTSHSRSPEATPPGPRRSL